VVEQTYIETCQSQDLSVTNTGDRHKGHKTGLLVLENVKKLQPVIFDGGGVCGGERVGHVERWEAADMCSDRRNATSEA